MKLVLSICIPTYNRAAVLRQNLWALIPQCVNRPVEICVSNNASTDETAWLLTRHPKIRAITQESNIGIDRNILAALRMAKGKYVLPIGDDEVLKPRGVERILAALEADPDMLILNGAEDIVVTDCREAFERFWDKMPLGGFVIRREYSHRRFTDRYLGTQHAYSGAAWDYLLGLDTVSIRSMADWVVEFKQVPKSYASWADIVHFRDIPQWFDLLPPHYSNVAALAKRQHWRSCTAPRALVHFGAIWLRRHV